MQGVSLCVGRLTEYRMALVLVALFGRQESVERVPTDRPDTGEQGKSQTP